MWTGVVFLEYQANRTSSGLLEASPGTGSSTDSFPRPETFLTDGFCRPSQLHPPRLPEVRASRPYCSQARTHTVKTATLASAQR